MIRLNRMTLIGAVALSCLAGAALASGGGGGGGGGGGDMGAPGPQYDPVAEYQKGVAALQASKWKDAERAFGHVTEAAPKAPEGWFLLGFSRANQGDFKGARKAYEKAAKLKPDDVDTHRELALTLVKLGETDKATAELDALKARDATCAGKCPDSAALKTAVARVQAAMTAAATPVVPAAPAGMSLLLFGDPASGDRAYGTAVALINQHRWSDALAALDEASRAVGPHPDIFTYRGYVLRRMGQLDAAETWYRAALAIAPEHRGATEYYGELKVLRGDLAGARVMLSRLEKQCTYGCPEEVELRRWIEAGGQPL